MPDWAAALLAVDSVEIDGKILSREVLVYAVRSALTPEPGLFDATDGATALERTLEVGGEQCRSRVLRPR